jgi:hypothetical protein
MTPRAEALVPGLRLQYLLLVIGNLITLAIFALVVVKRQRFLARYVSQTNVARR